MAEDNPTAGQVELRAFLRAIYNGLGQPPIGGQLRVTLIAAIDLLAEPEQ